MSDKGLSYGFALCAVVAGMAPVALVLKMPMSMIADHFVCWFRSRRSLPPPHMPAHRTTSRFATSMAAVQAGVARQGLLALFAVVVLPAAGCSAWWTKGPIDEPMLQSRQLTMQATYAAQRGDTARAEALLLSAVDVCEGDADARRELAELLWQQERSVEALAMFDEAIDLAPEDHVLLVRRGELLREMGMNGEARRNADHALKLSSNFAPGWLLRARVAREFGNSPDAVHFYQRALDIVPEDTTVLQELAELQLNLAMAGGPEARTRLQMALASSQKLLEVVPPDTLPAERFAFHGVVCRELKRYEDAASMFGLACQRTPDNADLWYQLADCNQLAGNFNEARFAATRALRLNSAHPLAPRFAALVRPNAMGPERLARPGDTPTSGTNFR